MSDDLSIAVVARQFPALSETFVLDQVTGLIDRGHRVVPIAEAPRDDPSTHRDFKRYDLAERTVYARIPGGYFRRVLTAVGIFARRRGPESRILLRSLNVRRYGRDAASLRLLIWADRLLDTPAFDIIHCHFGPVGQTMAKLREIGAISGRLVTVFHGVDISHRQLSEPNTYAFLFRKGDLFLPISRRWADRLLELGCDHRRLDVHRMGVDLRRFDYRPRSPEADEPLRILTVGRLVEKKGGFDALRAVAAVNAEGIAVKLNVVGDGPLRTCMQIVAHELEIADDVIFHGWRNQNQVAQMMGAADILLAPSVTAADGDQEGLPISIMEAMASGLPVVATDHSGIPELVEDGVTGMLVPERDPAALAAAIVTLHRSAKLRAAIRGRARKRIESSYDQAKLTKILTARFDVLHDAAPAKAPAKDTARFPARRIARYSRRGHRRVEGWLTPLDARLIRAVGAAQEGFGIYGGVGEIGVHHGKLFILLYLLLRQNERGIAIDIFDRQELNVDRSGKGNLDRFLKNTTRCAGRLDALEFLEKNSRSATADEILQKLGQPARLFSVDGGHTAELTLNDLTLADETLCPGGIAILDDCFNRHWPAVSEGLATFMSTGSGRMVPFAIGENKVLLCRPAMQTRYLAYLTQRRRSLQFLKTSEFYGYETAIFQHPRTVYARLARMPELRRFVERHSTIARLKPLISRLAG